MRGTQREKYHAKIYILLQFSGYKNQKAYYQGYVSATDKVTL